ncbi:hypothetical protein HELRODRAFT_171011 [Helobdella robusta]|uniref:AAA+ ATPase domain-containing protein n=1 Tax=Helobdella robusta TaxID=6412 RepID=T1F3P5_HELRO|nr:hypothetical protein HELRODRAFT_171011 [Helobdella robusta]ESO06976.1 hypothetical protein HELRODRAFT_171011 [Helobdella robusta]
MADEVVDERVDFVSRFVHLSLKAKPDKWVKMYSMEENRNVFKTFFDDPECTTLLILVNQSNGHVQPTLEWPQQLKGSKTFYFIKRSNVALPKTVKLGKLLIYGDISPSPIDQLYSFVDEVIFPLITNKMNQTSWPHVVVKDLARQVSAMKNKTYVTTGQIKGKTLLPQPVGTEKMDKAHFNFLNKNLIHSIETVLIEWSHQIHDELKKDSAQPLLDGLSPLPYVEFEFWKVKSINLECIYDQLQSSKIRMFAEFLEKANSSYFATFKSMFQDVVAATVEAQDIYLYLKPLQRILEEMEAKSFEDIRMSYHVLMHCLCLIWTNSNYYNKSERIIVLMQEICNFLITMCRSYLDAHDIFKGEVDETLVKVQTAVNNLIYFKEVFKHYQTQLRSYFKNDDTKEWDFSTQLVFHQYDKFISRVELLKNFFENIIELLKLEKIDYSGLKGKILNAGTAALFKDVNELLKVFQEVTYDALDLTDDSFLKDYERYQSTMFDLDQKLATIACQAFDDCESLESCFKLCTIFGSLLNRPLVHQQFDTNYPRMLSMADKELFDVHSLFKKQMARYQKTGRFRLHKNKPQVAGFIEYCLELKERMDRLIVLFNNVNHPVETEVFRSWAEKVDEEVLEGLKFPLLFRDQETLLIRPNLSTKLVTVLREMKYLSTQVLPADLPDKCISLFAGRTELLNYWAILDLVSMRYNKVLTTVLEIEYPIILPELTYIDELLIKAEATLDWSNESTGEYLQNIKSIVINFEQRLQQSKDNVGQIQKIMATWSKVPLFDRSEEKGSSLLSFKDAEERARRRYNEIKTAGNLIHDLIDQNRELLKVGDASEDVNYWLAYIDYIDEIVSDGFFKIIECSLKFLVDNTANMADCEPLFETVLDLVVPEMFFKPAMQFGIADGFYDMIDGLAGDIYRQAAKIKRVSEHSNQKNYQPQMEDLPELTNLRTELMQHVTNIMSKSLLYMDSFDPYQSLWLDNRHEFMQQFLCFGHILTREEITLMDSENILFTPPSLKQFKEKIEFFEEMYAGIEKMEPFTLIENWFRIDAKPFLTSLLREVNKWIKMMRRHLANHVVNSLNNLEKFIVEVNQGLQRELVEGDIDALVDLMSILAKVKERQQKTDEMFEPLKLIIELLKQYQEDLPEEVSQQLQVLPDKWISTKKKAVVVKQQLTPLISYEVGLLKKNVSVLEVKQQEFREDFKRIRAFYFDCDEPYKLMDEVNSSVVDLETELSVMLIRGSLLEVSIPDFKQLKQCRKELTMLKNLWDYTYVIRNTIEFWKKTPWKEINIDFMDTECKKFSKDLKGLDKEMRSWDVYIGTENVAKNLVTSLKSVTELQNSAIRDRHWMELMETTGVQFSLTNRTTLADLLSLNLHNYEEEVKTIVDKAVKEMSMEKILKELNNTWAIMEFEHEVHQRTKVTLLKASEEMLEIMADNQIQLQNMLSSKFIAHFLDEVSEWQQKLSTADQVITIYMEVQRTWMHLESIFIGSEDIRKQLPEDTMRFDYIDSDFKLLVKDIEKTKNVVEATNQPNLYPTLEALQNQLTLCEKALSNYLETKRLAFPRFYFVSSVDLLDILSNGNNPIAVARHLTKLFDSMAKLTFELDSEGNPTKRAIGMTSKDGEYVTLSPSPCDCEGQVEVWLMQLLIVHCLSVKQEITEAVASYEEKPREIWIFEPPAQPALVSVQIWWCTEVNMAFQRLEEGYENALKEFNKKQISQLNVLIMMLTGKLTEGDRQKIMTICTIEVHNRDVISKLIAQKVEHSQAFAWLSQLRHRWSDAEKDCFANICDAQFKYMHEYLGNTPRLVITPLTDRCYITLTQSLHLMMSGAPAGPAGTGKTETTKDLGRALGVMVYVFNCSEQMDYKSIGNIYKGLAQSGAWGCFDEFNRISVEVLSVVAVQVKSIQDAIKDRKKAFNFIGELITLVPTVGIFITMNPGYAGRTELPENLKALFRPCAMVVPDFELICEIMLVAEGFLDARLLARKFITLYTLCKELLSKQDHYDWGLRAIKSVLVVAGKLKRSDSGRAEDQVLMRALRDFNIPKIITDDLPVFMGLIGDLFPALDVPRKRDLDFEKKVKEAILDLKLQAEDSFVLKVVQLQELFEVRHSVFIVGNSGTGKSMVWKSLFKTNQNLRKKPVAIDLDPKAVTNNELFGVINPSTREWKDGLFSVIMRDLAYQTHDGPKWIVLDGDIDPMWIESLNTVMDDNKILTLASNERIPLTPSMRLLFEISHLKTATPATVSRAGILYINPQDLGWNPYVSSWVDRRENQTERVNLLILFDKYIPVLLDTMKSKFKKITPIVDICHLQMLLNLLECMLTPDNVPPDCPKEWYEIYFVFCLIWSFGGCLFQDQLVDHRVEFSKWWVGEFKVIKFPSTGTIFDYYIDSETKKFEPWSKKTAKFYLEPNVSLKSVMVDTNETTRIGFFLDLLIKMKRPVMLVGNAGTGKSVLMNSKLNDLGEDYMVANVPFNFYTSSEILQKVLEKPLEKKAGKNYGPRGGKKLIYFIDDMNMPEVDKYFTVQPHTIIRQHLNYGHWYDRIKLSLKEIHGTQYVSCMNPTAGSFTIDSRLLRHFAIFALSFPGGEALNTIYNSILSQHASQTNFSLGIQRLVPNLVTSSLFLHSKIASIFLPTAVKFHYIYNLRDISNIFQGLLFSTLETITQPYELVRLWVHETHRVYRDKLVDEADMQQFDKLVKETIKKHFEELPSEQIFEKPLLYCHFATSFGDPKSHSLILQSIIVANNKKH